VKVIDCFFDEDKAMKVTTIGIDLAKEIFAVHGVDSKGHTVLRKALKRHGMAKFFANLEPCLVGMEACGSAHHWARKIRVLRSHS
jgi:transposase